METSAATRPGLELVVHSAYMQLTIIEWECQFENTGLYFLKDTINLRPLNRTGFYSEETSIRGNMVLTRSLANMAACVATLGGTGRVAILLLEAR